MTSGTPRPRRSVLFLPASNERALIKARTIPADAVILDLEDAVAPDAKQRARELACAAVASGDLGRREVTVRVNARGTAWHEDDLRAVCAAAPDAVVVPKTGSADEVRAVVDAMTDAGAADRTRLWAMVETPRAVLDCAAIAGASPRLEAIVVGTNDLLKDLGAGAVAGRAPLLTALSMCVLGARAAGVAVLDGVFNDVRDLDGFAAECRQGRTLGFDGKTLIHPSQVDLANETFAPSDAEVDAARRTVEAYEAAVAAGRGVATLDGRMVESLHVESARATLATRALLDG